MALDVHCKIWIEHDGRAVFGDGRIRLLQAIADAGSLTAAAKALRMPYRTAWQHLRLMEKAYGRKLLERKTGGAKGGECCLTQAGEALLRSYARFRRGVDEMIEKRFRRFMLAER